MHCKLEFLLFFSFVLDRGEMGISRVKLHSLAHSCNKKMLSWIYAFLSVEMKKIDGQRIRAEIFHSLITVFMIRQVVISGEFFFFVSE